VPPHRGPAQPQPPPGHVSSTGGWVLGLVSMARDAEWNPGLCPRRSPACSPPSCGGFCGPGAGLCRPSSRRRVLVPGGCPGSVGALSPAPSWSPVPAAQLCFCSSLQPDVGLRKGPVAAQRSRSRSAPPASGQGLLHRPAGTSPLPRLCWWVPTMEEMVIWEQHTVTLSKVSTAQGG